MFQERDWAGAKVCFIPSVVRQGCRWFWKLVAAWETQQQSCSCWGWNPLVCFNHYSISFQLLPLPWFCSHFLSPPLNGNFQKSDSGIRPTAHLQVCHNMPACHRGCFCSGGQSFCLWSCQMYFLLIINWKLQSSLLVSNSSFAHYFFSKAYNEYSGKVLHSLMQF